jgi:hypothetical protein
MFDNIPYLIGQALGILAVLLGFLSFQRKTAAGIILTQMCAALVFAVHYTLLSAPTAIALNLLFAVNCVYCYFRDKRGSREKIGTYILIVLVIAIGIVTWEGWYTAALVAGLVFNTISIALEDPQNTRRCMLIKTPLCFLYNLMVGSLGGMIYECTVLTSSIIGIIRYRNKPKA